MASLTLIEGEAQPVDDRVRAVVRMLLAATGMKPVDLAEHIGLSKNQVWDRLRGDKPFSVAEVVDMAALFEVPVQAFIAGPAALLKAGQGQLTRPYLTDQLRAPRKDTPQRPPLRLAA